MFRVDQLEPVRWNDAAFDSLILPGNEKTLAWEFVESKGLENNSFDDFIEDKGLLGTPGAALLVEAFLSNALKVAASLSSCSVRPAWARHSLPKPVRLNMIECQESITDKMIVAERARVPLYAMSAGTLGTSPEQVEASLDRALGLCEMWNAMLLLDEADVFLGARTDTDLARNELVSGEYIPTELASLLGTVD